MAYSYHFLLERKRFTDFMAVWVDQARYNHVSFIRKMRVQIGSGLSIGTEYLEMDLP